MFEINNHPGVRRKINNYLIDFREHGMFRSILDHWLVQLQVKHLWFEVKMQDTIGPDGCYN